MILCVPDTSVEIRNVAVAPLKPTVFSVFVPSTKVTVPVTIAPNYDAMVAVNVTGWPTVDGFCEDVRVAVILGERMIC